MCAAVLRDPEDPRDRDAGSNDAYVCTYVRRLFVFSRDIGIHTYRRWVVVAVARSDVDDDVEEGREKEGRRGRKGGGGHDQ